MALNDDIYYNIIKLSKGKDIISLYFVDKNYHRVLNKTFILKELSNQYHIKIDTFKNFIDFINIKIRCGYDYTTLIKNNELYVWGDNEEGQLGLGHNNHINVPTKLNFKAHKIVCGGYHTIAITDDGLYVWGYNNRGQLGLGHYNSVNVPTKLNFDFKINKIVCSSNHTIAITDDGLYAWGANGSGQLGLGHNNRVNMPTKLIYN